MLKLNATDKARKHFKTCMNFVCCCPFLSLSIFYDNFRYGLYGLPFDEFLFNCPPPSIPRGSSAPTTYASITNTDRSNSTTWTLLNDDVDLRESVLNITSNNGKSRLPEIKPAHLLHGLLETEPLHFTCVSASDGTRLERIETG